MAYEFINQTDILGTILESGTLSLTGSMVATLMFLLMFLLIVCIMFRIPFEFSAIILLPITISMGAYYSNFFAPLIVILIYISMVIAKNWIFK